MLGLLRSTVRRRVRLVKTAVICCALRKSISRSSIACTSTSGPTERLLIGSTTTASGSNSLDVAVHAWPGASPGRRASAARRGSGAGPSSRHGARSMPDRAHVADDLAAATPRRRSRGSARRGGRRRRRNARPGWSCRCPRRPRRGRWCRGSSRPPPSMASSPGTPVENRSSEASWLEAGRGDRQDGDAVLVDQERVLVGAVRRAAVLDDPQPAGGDLVVHPVVEQDHAVGDVLLEALAGELRRRRARR